MDEYNWCYEEPDYELSSYEEKGMNEIKKNKNL
jgi:hypothetical protein